MESISHASKDHIPATEVITARGLAPAIIRRTEEIEIARRLPADLALKLAEAGLFRIAQPRVYGGAELHPSDIVRVIEEVSRAYGFGRVVCDDRRGHRDFGRASAGPLGMQHLRH